MSSVSVVSTFCRQVSGSISETSRARRLERTSGVVSRRETEHNLHGLLCSGGFFLRGRRVPQDVRESGWTISLPEAATPSATSGPRDTSETPEVTGSGGATLPLTVPL